jgi:hypothetical protein
MKSITTEAKRDTLTLTTEKQLIHASAPAAGKYMPLPRVFMQPHTLGKFATFVLLSTASGAWSCAHRSKELWSPNEVSKVEVASDTVLFSAVVQAIRESKPQPWPVILQVDPRPLKIDTQAGSDIRPEIIAALPTAVLDMRAAILNNLGVAQVDAFTSRACASWAVVVFSPPERRSDLIRDCPVEGQLVVAMIGLPRFGHAPWSRSTADWEEEARLGHWSVLVIEQHFGPAGGARLDYAYIFKRSTDGRDWQFVKVELLFAVD